MAAGHSIIGSKVKNADPELIRLCNTCVKQAKAHSIKIKVWPIKPEDLRLVVFTDSAFDPKGERHQHGWISGFTNPSDICEPFYLRFSYLDLIGG